MDRILNHFLRYMLPYPNRRGIVVTLFAPWHDSEQFGDMCDVFARHARQTRFTIIAFDGDATRGIATEQADYVNQIGSRVGCSEKLHAAHVPLRNFSNERPLITFLEDRGSERDTTRIVGTGGTFDLQMTMVALPTPVLNDPRLPDWCTFFGDDIAQPTPLAAKLQKLPHNLVRY